MIAALDSSRPLKGGRRYSPTSPPFPGAVHPRLGERLSFEIGIGKDGKQQAKNIVCPTRPAEKPYRLSEPARRPHKPGLLGRLIPLAFAVALGAYGYNEYTHRATPQTAYEAPSNETAAPSLFHCDGRQYCSQMHSKAEAEYFLRNCPDTKMDGYHDGIPCENDSRF